MPQKIAQAILADFMENGRLRPGERLPSVRDFEQQYAASRTTITAALNLLEQQGRLAKRHGSGCFVAERPVPDSQNRPELLGFISPSAESELMLRIYAGVERVCRIHDVHILVASACHDYETEQWQARRMIDAGCRAIVLSPVSRTPRQLQDDYLKDQDTALPVVLVDIAYPEQGRAQVVFDNYRAGYDMTEMLLHEGHERIAIMYLDLSMHYAVRERNRGYLDALRFARRPCRAEDRWCVPGLGLSPEEIRAWLTAWRAQPERPTALIALEDRVAIQVIQQAQDLGIRVPEELCVTGFDNLAGGRSFSPPFPTTEPDFRRAGEIATRLAIQQMRGEPGEPCIYMLPVPVRRRRAAHDHRPSAAARLQE
jgi:DNA-binding LacI/PurR family transcriptional regulator